MTCCEYEVALRKESVDRNIGVGTTRDSLGVSLSARRAWIEIMMICSGTATRNRSLSARRAWIEIIDTATALNTSRVALRKESVDRNV